LSVGEVSFLRAKLDDRLYKTLLILKSGEIVHVNLTQQELDELVQKVELHMDDYGAKIYRTSIVGGKGTCLQEHVPVDKVPVPTEESIDSSPELPDTPLDSMLDDLTTNPTEG
jgi:hypothetical protein